MASEMTGEERAEFESWLDSVSAGADEDPEEFPDPEVELDESPRAPWYPHRATPTGPACINAIFCGCPACEANDWYAEIRRCVTWHDEPESHEEVPY